VQPRPDRWSFDRPLAGIAAGRSSSTTERVLDAPRSSNREHAVSRFGESFASALAEAGPPHVPVLVFAAILEADDDGLTADELVAQLGIVRA
jgi:hypothetical protein